MLNNLIKHENDEFIISHHKKQPLTVRNAGYPGTNSVFSFDLMATDEEPDDDELI